jgi:hypothetical protein
MNVRSSCRLLRWKDTIFQSMIEELDDHIGADDEPPLGGAKDEAT